MALQVPPELERRVTALANATQRDPQAVLDELLAAALEEGFVSQDEHTARLEALQHDITLAQEQVRRGEVFDMSSGQIEALLNGTDG